jgi:hypothetical protein
MSKTAKHEQFTLIHPDKKDAKGYPIYVIAVSAHKAAKKLFRKAYGKHELGPKSVEFRRESTQTIYRYSVRREHVKKAVVIKDPETGKVRKTTIKYEIKVKRESKVKAGEVAKPRVPRKKRVEGAKKPRKKRTTKKKASKKKPTGGERKPRARKHRTKKISRASHAGGLDNAFSRLF